MKIVKFLKQENELYEIVKKKDIPKNYRRWAKKGIKATKNVLGIKKDFIFYFIKNSNFSFLGEYVIGSSKKRPIILFYIDNIEKEIRNEKITPKELILRIGIHEPFHYFLEEKYENIFGDDEEEDWVLNMEQKTWEKYFSK